MQHANISHRVAADVLRALVVAVLLAAAIPAAVGAANPRSRQAATQKHATDPCAALAKELAGLDSRMRAGYGGKAGERLRDRQREALDEFHRLRCRRL